MQKLYNKGATDRDFIISNESLNYDVDISMFDNYFQVRDPELKNHIDLNSKRNNAQEFWNTFHKLHRPMVYYKSDQGYKSLYNSSNIIIFNKLALNSPPYLGFIGDSTAIKWIGNALANGLIGVVIAQSIPMNIPKTIAESFGNNGNNAFNSEKLRPVKSVQAIENQLNSDEITNNITTNNNTTTNNTINITQENTINIINIFPCQQENLQKDDYKLLKELDSVHDEEMSEFLQNELKNVNDKFIQKIIKEPFLLEEIYDITNKQIA